MMEVTINPPAVKLENDSILRARDVVCLLDALPTGASPSSQLVNNKSKMKNIFVAGKGGYVAGSGYSRPLEDYELEKGKIKVAETVRCTSQSSVTNIINEILFLPTPLRTLLITPLIILPQFSDAILLVRRGDDSGDRKAGCVTQKSSHPFYA